MLEYLHVKKTHEILVFLGALIHVPNLPIGYNLTVLSLRHRGN